MICLQVCCVWDLQCLMVGLILGFLWVHRLQDVLVLQQVPGFQVVRPLPSPHVLHEDPAIRTMQFFPVWCIPLQHLRYQKLWIEKYSPSFQALLLLQVDRTHQVLPAGKAVGHSVLTCFKTIKLLKKEVSNTAPSLQEVQDYPNHQEDLEGPESKTSKRKCRHGILLH